MSAMTADERPADDKAIDENRKPIEVLTFFGVDEGMTVLEVVAAAGYYTELLSAAVGPTGTVYMHNDQGTLTRNDGAVEKSVMARLAGNRLPNVRRLNTDVVDTGLSGEADIALIILELHDTYNFAGRDAAVAMLRAVHDALKPGGTLGLVEHAGNAGADNRSLHRIEKSVAEQLLRDAGFEIEAESNVLANAADDHTAVVFDPSIRRRTDRFVIRARRPD
jgi:predicted methyltransferase